MAYIMLVNTSTAQKKIKQKVCKSIMNEENPEEQTYDDCGQQLYFILFQRQAQEWGVNNNHEEKMRKIIEYNEHFDQSGAIILHYLVEH